MEYKERIPTINQTKENIEKPKRVESVDFTLNKEHERWERTDLHCLSCGEKSIWVADAFNKDEQDDEPGSTYLCIKCETGFVLSEIADKEDQKRMLSDKIEKKINAIKKALRQKS